MADLYNHCLSDTPMCEHCIDSVEDAHHYFFTCSKYTNFRDVLCLPIQNIFDCDHIFDITESFQSYPPLFKVWHYVFQQQNEYESTLMYKL